MHAPNNGQEASELLPLHSLEGRDSEDSENDRDLFAEEEYYGPGFNAINHAQLSRSQKIVTLIRTWVPLPFIPRSRQSPSAKPTTPHKPWKRRILLQIALLAFAWALFIVLFFPSYTRPPAHYVQLSDRIGASALPGRANLHKEKVFIAASIYDGDGELLNGDWGKNVLGLIELLGPDNVFLSIYENDASDTAAKAMGDFGSKVECR